MSQSNFDNNSSATKGGSKDKPNNPFDFDVDFDAVKHRRQKALEKKAKEERAAQGLPEIDEEEERRKKEAQMGGGPGGMNQMGGAGAIRMGGFRFGWGQAGDEDEDDEEKEDVLYGGKRIVSWPYDDYDHVQKKYWTRVEELASGGVMDPAMEKKLQQEAEAKEQQDAYERPPDPPDIPTAVTGLGLVDFESKAEERAIMITSTWLYDAGLIDELLVHGGMSTSIASSTALSADGGGGDGDGSVKSGVDGVEDGTSRGFPTEGASKMDIEMSKLRTSTQRQLALINARLNDGVAASGGEVQELVNAVTATKDDLVKLRELSTYISNAGDVERSSKFLLTRYPKLKKAINARRNLQRCFRELDFYSQIPVTCDGLREELFSCEWTDAEWQILRNVAREHVELEIFLVEAESGMKKRIDEETQERREGGGTDPNKKEHPSSYLQSRQTAMNGRSSFVTLPHNYEEVDNFLGEHVKNVWELGDEIRMRIMSGIGTAFELAMNNPAGMVALVEAVEVYETANEEYKTVHGEEAGRNQTLRFTDMRAAALTQIYQDFETRGLRVFQDVQMNAQGSPDDDDPSNAIFSAVLRAANGLTSEIGFVQSQMAPCFPPYWALETLWSTCVAHVCSKQILDQIGGPEGHKLPDLTVTQLLDLVAWVENFRETIEESFPNIGDHSSKKTYFDERPELLMDNNKQVDMDVAKDSLAWANNMLWNVHDLAKDEFLFRTKEQTEVWLENVYSADHMHNQTSEGRLITSLCEDVFSLAGVQLRTIRERLTRRSEALVQAVGVIFKNLYHKQIECRDNSLTELELCCAAANDFLRMSEKCEDILSEMVAECNLSPAAAEALEEQSAILLGLYSSDAVFAAQKVHIYIFEPIEESIGDELFGDEWLNVCTQNEQALTLVRTLEDFMGDLESFLDEVMVGKAVEALVTASVNFYIKCLLRKAANKKDTRNSIWSDDVLALQRIRGDVRVMKEYFQAMAPSFPSLNRTLDGEFEVLDTIHELLSIASGQSSSNSHDFVLMLQKRIRNEPITKLLVGDLWHLVKPADERKIYEMIDDMEEELKAVAPTDESAMKSAQDRKAVPGLRLDQVVAMVCDQNKRSRPLKKTALEQTNMMMERWRETWVAAVSDEL